ncbi:MAG TPA: hypothetical protein VM305_01190 [Candidatus Limnocylindrales bacterium]|nr:hypothetical protein [Candidatus Limnocylindrales bacterium]
MDDNERREAAIEREARRLGFRNPALAVRALAGEAGEPATLVRELAEAEPYLTGSEGLLGALRAEPPPDVGDPGMNELLRAMRGSPEEARQRARDQQGRFTRPESFGDYGGGNRGASVPSAPPSQSEQMNAALRSLVRNRRGDPINSLGRMVFGPHEEE